MKTRSLLVPVALLASGIVDLRAENLKTVDDFRAAAAKANAVLTIPDWEQTPEAVDAMTKNAIATANKALDQFGAQDHGKVTFKSTIVALDDLAYQAGNAANKAVIIKESNTNEKMRSAAENAVKEFQDWAVGIDYREDVYKALKAFADTKPKLFGEDKKLFDETMRDYRRAGLALPPEKRKEVEQLRKELAKLGTDFDTNIVNGKAPVVFTKAELEGVPESFFASPGVKTGDDAYTVLANVTWQYNTVEDNAKSEATRKKLYVARDSLAKDTNQTVLNQMIALRNKIALRLGYKSWDDFQTEIKMAKTGAGAKKYIDDLQFYIVTDATTGEPLGMFYLDMFPREGKFNHFAEFEIIGGKLLPDGKYQRPVATLLCNFPPPSADKPSLMTHSDVEV